MRPGRLPHARHGVLVKQVVDVERYRPVALGYRGRQIVEIVCRQRLAARAQSRRPSASCDAPPRKDARASRHRIAATGLGAAVAGHRPSVRRGSRLGRTDEPSRDRGTRGDGAGRRGRQDSCCCTRVWLRQAGDGMTTHTQCRRCRRRACRDRRGARGAQGRSHAGALPRR